MNLKIQPRRNREKRKFQKEITSYEAEIKKLQKEAIELEFN